MTGKRIGIDIRALTPPMTGTGVYLREILLSLARMAPDNDYLCYTTRPTAGDNLPPGPFHLRVGRGLSSRWGTVWLQMGIKSLVVEDGLDLFWGPLQVLPLGLLGRLPTVVTVHDLVFRYYPQTMSFRNRLALARVAERSIRSADAVLAVSRATAVAVEREFAVPTERIRVIHHGAGDRFRPQDRGAAHDRVREKFAVRGDYLLFVGTLEPRKNLEGLLRAFLALAQRPGFDGELVIVGTSGWRMRPFFQRLRGHPLADRIHVTGYVDESDLPDLYSAARLLVIPSKYEGFGLPVLEAMSCGTPVICSDVPPFPEVTAGAARLVPVDDVGGLVQSIAQVWSDPQLRHELSRRGLERAGDFSWERSTRLLLDCFDGLLSKWRDR